MKSLFRNVHVRKLSSGNSKLKVYGFALSQPTRSVLMLLKEGNIDFDFIIVNALKGENRRPEFKKISPTGLVPTITDTDNDFTLSESGAILQYVAEKYKILPLYPQDITEKAKINFWLHWNHTNSRYESFFENS